MEWAWSGESLCWVQYSSNCMPLYRASNTTYNWSLGNLSAVDDLKVAGSIFFLLFWKKSRPKQKKAKKILFLCFYVFFFQKKIRQIKEKIYNSISDYLVAHFRSPWSHPKHQAARWDTFPRTTPHLLTDRMPYPSEPGNCIIYVFKYKHECSIPNRRLQVTWISLFCLVSCTNQAKIYQIRKKVITTDIIFWAIIKK